MPEPVVELTGPTTARVHSQTSEAWYAVDLERGECSCKGFSYRKKCAHLDAARDVVQGRMVDEPVVPFDLYTSRYMNREQIVESGLVPVGITVGRPRFVAHLPYASELIYVDVAAPKGILGEQDMGTFHERYIEHLESVGVDEFRRRFSAIASAHAGRGLVLLCYEDLTQEGEWCHRRMFAAWWHLRTGEEVPEL